MRGLGAVAYFSNHDFSATVICFREMRRPVFSSCIPLFISGLLIQKIKGESRAITQDVLFWCFTGSDTNFLQMGFDYIQTGTPVQPMVSPNLVLLCRSMASTILVGNCTNLYFASFWSSHLVRYRFCVICKLVCSHPPANERANS